MPFPLNTSGGIRCSASRLEAYHWTVAAATVEEEAKQRHRKPSILNERMRSMPANTIISASVSFWRVRFSSSSPRLPVDAPPVDEHFLATNGE